MEIPELEYEYKSFWKVFCKGEFELPLCIAIVDVHIRIQINSGSLQTNNKPPLEAFKLVKWFIEINTTKQVPKELMECIKQEEAIEMLGN